MSEPRLGRAATSERIASAGIMAVVRAKSDAQVVDAVATLVESGITAIELTMTTPRALDLLKTLRNLHGPALLLGMGSVTTKEQALVAVQRGADFVVSPVALDIFSLPDVVHIPAGATPTELWRGHEAGAPLVKLFPASAAGPRFVKEVLAPFPDLRIMPSGGVSIESIPEWREAGVAMVSLGGSLLGDALSGGDLVDLKMRSRQAVSLWSGAPLE